jgi:hypothetical protein
VDASSPIEGTKLKTWNTHQVENFMLNICKVSKKDLTKYSFDAIDGQALTEIAKTAEDKLKGMGFPGGGSGLILEQIKKMETEQFKTWDKDQVDNFMVDTCKVEKDKLREIKENFREIDGEALTKVHARGNGGNPDEAHEGERQLNNNLNINEGKKEGAEGQKSSSAPCLADPIFSSYLGVHI